MDEEDAFVPILETPQDLYELYMTKRAEMSSSKDFYQYYMGLLFLIDVGKEMLLDRDSRLREEAERVLSSSKSYPESRQMEITSQGNYRMGPGTSSTGLIHIHSEDLDLALKEVKNQQATALVPKLKDLDSKIFKALIRSGIIEIKKPSTEELLLQSVIEDIEQNIEGEEDDE